MVEIKKLTSRHRAIMLDLCTGMKPCEAALKHDITESRLSIIRRSPLWMEEEKALRMDFLEMHKTRVSGLLDQALDVVENCMGSMDEKIALAAAKDAQNRGGLVHETVVEGAGAQVRIVLGD